MRVYYPGPGTKTYHPQLGKLITGKHFDLDDKLAEKYVDSGLLKEARSSHLPAGRQSGLKTEKKVVHRSRVKPQTDNGQQRTVNK